MPAIQVSANTSGSALWNQQLHKRGELVGLKVNNRHTQDVTIDLLDCFTTNASTVAASAAAQAVEDFNTIVGSGRPRGKITVPVGELVSLGKADLEETTFLGKAYARADILTANCVIVATYKLK